MTITTTAHLGFLLRSAYVGLLADLAGLRPAVIAVAALTLGFTIVAAPASRVAQRVPSPREHAPERP